MLSALSINYTLTPIKSSEDGEVAQKWEEQEVITAIYEDDTDVLVDTTRHVDMDFSSH